MPAVVEATVHHKEMQQIRTSVITEGGKHGDFVRGENFEIQRSVTFDSTHEAPAINMESAPLSEAPITCRMCGSMNDLISHARCRCCGYLRRNSVDGSVSTAPLRVPSTIAPGEILLPEPPQNTVATVHLWGNASRLDHSQESSSSSSSLSSSSSSSQLAPTLPVGRSAVLPAAVALALSWCSLADVSTLRKASPAFAWACPSFTVQLNTIHADPSNRHVDRPLSAPPPSRGQSSSVPARAPTPSATQQNTCEPVHNSKKHGSGSSAQRQVLLRRRAAVLRGRGSAGAPEHSSRLQEWRQKQQQKQQQEPKTPLKERRSSVGGSAGLSSGPAKIGIVTSVVESASVPTLLTKHDADASLSVEEAKEWAHGIVLEFTVLDSTGLHHSGIKSSSGASGEMTELPLSSSSTLAADESSTKTLGKHHYSSSSTNNNWRLKRTWVEAQALVRRLKFNIRRLPLLPSLPPLLPPPRATSSSESSNIGESTTKDPSTTTTGSSHICNFIGDKTRVDTEWARWKRDVAVWMHDMALHPSVSASGLWLAFIGANGARARSAWANEDVIAEIGKVDMHFSN